MLMQAATVETLIEKANFEPRIALAVAEAIDEAIESEKKHFQPVTVPVLDARLAKMESGVDAKFSALKSGIDARFAAVDAGFAKMENTMDLRFAAVDARFVKLENTMELRFAAVDSTFAKLEGVMDARFANVDVKLMQLENRLLLKLIGLGTVGIGILLTVLRVFRDAF